MNNSIRFSVLMSVTVALGLLQGCAHQQQQALDNHLQAEAPVQSSDQLGKLARDQIQASPDLTENEKTQLLELQSSTHAKLNDLRDQSLKLRELLIKDLLQTDYNAGEVSQIKKRIKNVENQRLTTIFSAVEKANTLMGRKVQTHPELFLRDLAADRDGR